MKSDLKEYFNTMQLQYNEICKVADKVNEEIKEGKVTPEQKESFEKYFNTVKTNYDRVFYIIHLLGLPPKFIQKLQLKKLEREHEKNKKKLQEEFAEGSTLEEVKVENEQAIDCAKKELEKLGGDE